MSARTRPNLHLLKKRADRETLVPDPPPQRPEGKRVGEAYVSLDEAGIATMYERSVREDVPLRSDCFSHFQDVSPAGIQLCWQFDEAYPETITTKVLRAVAECVQILNKLISDDEDFSANARKNTKNEVLQDGGIFPSVSSGDEATLPCNPTPDENKKKRKLDTSGGRNSEGIKLKSRFKVQAHRDSTRFPHSGKRDSPSDQDFEVRDCVLIPEGKEETDLLDAKLTRVCITNDSDNDVRVQRQISDLQSREDLKLKKKCPMDGTTSHESPPTENRKFKRKSENVVSGFGKEDNRNSNFGRSGTAKLEKCSTGTGKENKGLSVRDKSSVAVHSTEAIELSSDSGSLYGEEKIFHDTLRNLRETEKPDMIYEELYRKTNNREDYGANEYGSSSQKPTILHQSRDGSVRAKTFTGETIDEVDRVFQGPKWKTFDERRRVTTILEQFHYLVNYYRVEDSRNDQVKSTRSRADIQAGKYLMAKRFCFNEGFSIVGSIPGLEIGDTFSYREEMLILIIHRTLIAGIEFIPASRSEYIGTDGQPAAVAVSIVSAGRYKDGTDDGEILTYIGSGGDKSLQQTKGQTQKDNDRAMKDQELVRGNLALKNSCDLGVPVRVIRGEHKKDLAGSNYTYWYDGLYDVTKYYEDTAISGSKVWKFQLVRQKGQRQA